MTIYGIEIFPRFSASRQEQALAEQIRRAFEFWVLETTQQRILLALMLFASVVIFSCMSRTSRYSHLAFHIGQ